MYFTKMTVLFLSYFLCFRFCSVWIVVEMTAVVLKQFKLMTLFFVLDHLAAGFVTNGSCLHDEQKFCQTGLLVRSNFPTVFLLWSCLPVHGAMIDNSKTEWLFLNFNDYIIVTVANVIK